MDSHRAHQPCADGFLWRFCTLLCEELYDYIGGGGGGGGGANLLDSPSVKISCV